MTHTWLKAIRRYWLSMVLSLSLIGLTGCPSADSAIPGGIRMYNYLQTGGFSSRIPIAGAYDQGVAGSGGIGGGFTSLSGFSDENGILDSPNTVLNVNWLFTWDFTGVDPECGLYSQSLYMAAPGSYATGVCETFYD